MNPPTGVRRVTLLRVSMAIQKNRYAVRIRTKERRYGFAIPTAAYCVESVSAGVRRTRRNNRRALLRTRMRLRNWRSLPASDLRHLALQSKPAEVGYRVSALLACRLLGNANVHGVETRLVGTLLESLGEAECAKVVRALMSTIELGKESVGRPEDEEAVIRVAMKLAGLRDLELVDLAIADVRHSLLVVGAADLDVSRPVEWIRSDEGAGWWREFAAPTLRSRATSDILSEYFRNQLVAGFACHLREKKLSEDARSRRRTSIAKRFSALASATVCTLLLWIVSIDKAGVTPVRKPDVVAANRTDVMWSATITADPITTGALPNKEPVDEAHSILAVKPNTTENRISAVSEPVKESAMTWRELEVKCKTREVDILATSKDGPEIFQPVSNPVSERVGHPPKFGELIDLACRS